MDLRFVGKSLAEQYTKCSFEEVQFLPLELLEMEAALRERPMEAIVERAGAAGTRIEDRKMVKDTEGLVSLLYDVVASPRTRSTKPCWR